MPVEGSVPAEEGNPLVTRELLMSLPVRKVWGQAVPKAFQPAILGTFISSRGTQARWFWGRRACHSPASLDPTALHTPACPCVDCALVMSQYLASLLPLETWMPARAPGIKTVLPSLPGAGVAMSLSSAQGDVTK